MVVNKENSTGGTRCTALLKHSLAAQAPLPLARCGCSTAALLALYQPVRKGVDGMVMGAAQDPRGAGSGGKGPGVGGLHVGSSWHPAWLRQRQAGMPALAKGWAVKSQD